MYYDDQAYDDTDAHLERLFLESVEFDTLPMARQHDIERLAGGDPMQEDTHAERASVLS